MQRTSVQALAFRLGDRPPRQITFLLRVAVWLTLTVAAAAPVGGAGVFMLIDLWNADPMAYLGPGPASVTKQGTVASFSHRKNKGRHTGDDVWVTFSIDGRPHEVVRHTQGDTLHRMPGEVTVDVDPRFPSRARVHGMNVASPGLAFMLVIAAVVALIILVWGGVRARKRLWLLENGLLTHGKVINHETKKGSKGSVTHIVTLEYQVGIEAFTHVVKTQSDPAHLLDEENEPMLYDPKDPARAFALDELQISPRHDESGIVEFTRTKPFAIATIAWLLALTLAVTGVAVPLASNGSEKAPARS